MTEFSEFWNTADLKTEADPLTLDVLLQTFEALKNQPYNEPHPCALGHHMISAKAKRRLEAGEAVRCFSCLVVFDLHEGRVRVLGH